MANLKVGSSGSDVEKLQQALIKAGYNVGNTGADGVYGSKTAAAVKQYQKDHGLSVDGIAGNNTMGSLYSTPQMNNALSTLAKGSVLGAQTVAGNNNAKSVNAANQGLKTMAGGAVAGAQIAAGAPVTANNVQSKKGKDPIKEVNLDETETGAPKTEIKESAEEEPVAGTPNVEVPSFSYAGYTDPEIVQQAWDTLQQHYANQPGAYQSQWQAQIQEYLNKIMNRDPFSYNFNEDALYQQYKDIYTQMGLMAMMDTMGQASAMTGGYGNSYAQTVGQQAYNQQLSQLNNVLPELYKMAFDRYAYEGDQMMNQYGLLMDQENMDYNRYMDSYNQWAGERDYLAGRYDTERDYAYNQYMDGYNQAWNEYVMKYQQSRDQVSDQQWQYEQDENKRRYEEGKTAGTSSGNTGNNTNTSDYDNGKLTTSQVKMIQEALGVTADGKWGDDSFKAAGNLTADEALKAYQRGELGAKKPTNTEPVFSDAAKAFMSNLPYAHAGSSAEQWKQVVEKKLMAQYENGTLTEADVEAIIIKLGL